MTKNVGSLDRTIRLVVGIVLLVLPFIAGWSMLWTVISVVVALVLLGTAAARTCPLYTMLGMKTEKS
ncbi:DUF2892 domain-containing protein [Tropicimonas sp. IMCC34043]|uniref:YgaP family membrane protein n=1 Tax=Tropicimonas sp. IMCC34043 TaxID=2248760 RepID=UPI000E289E09|nr:DUF2892 domain-containing protein [Tropicimonas sp. IMCC34043]